jgi:GNAT superfamily N-acetyltransferase
MPPGRVEIRRARRTNFTAVMGVLGASGGALPAPDRATLRRFRRLVADLGGDFYVASVDGVVAGLVHVTYARQLAAPPRASLDLLVVAPAFRRRGIGTALLAFTAQRARQRGCPALSFLVRDPADTTARTFLQKGGFTSVGERFVKHVRDPS